MILAQLMAEMSRHSAVHIIQQFTSEVAQKSTLLGSSNRGPERHRANGK